MEIRLKGIGRVRGPYGPNRDQFPARGSFLAPDAAAAFVEMVDAYGRDKIRFGSILRGAEDSLAAIQSKQGVQPPGFSGHNFGVSFDVDVEYTLRSLGWSYAELLEAFAAFGWYCYRRDGVRGHEDWHFNYLGLAEVPRVGPGRAAPGPAAPILAKLTAARNTWALGAELAILRRYPEKSFVLTPLEIQTALKRLRLYSGDLDGKFGPLSLQAVSAFCRAWKLSDGTSGRFQRTLAFVAADVIKEPAAPRPASVPVPIG